MDVNNNNNKYRQLFKKEIQHLCKRLAEEFGLILLKKSTLICNTQNILKVISFEWPPSGMHCNIGIMPLYYPQEYINYMCRDSLELMHEPKVGEAVESWGIVPEKMNEDIMQIEEKIRNSVLPLFADVSSALEFEDLLTSHDSRVVCSPKHRNILLAYSYTVLKKYHDAELYFQITKSEMPEGSNRLVDINRLIKMIQNEEYELINNELKNNIINSKAAIGIE